MTKTTISFDIKNTLLAETATAIGENMGRDDGESDVDLIKRYIDYCLVKPLNAKRARDIDLNRAISVMS